MFLHKLIPADTETLAVDPANTLRFDFHVKCKVKVVDAEGFYPILRLMQQACL